MAIKTNTWATELKLWSSKFDLMCWSGFLGIGWFDKRNLPRPVGRRILKKWDDKM